MKKLTFTIVCLFLLNLTFAQPKNNHSYLHISFLPPLSTNGKFAPQYTNDVSFNILAGVSRNERAFTFGGIANIILNNANGVQMAGIYNYVGNNGMGVLFGGIGNRVKNYVGCQIGGISNIAKDFTGFQFSGLHNKAADFEGAQIGGLINTAADFEGIQMGGLINKCDEIDGVQISGLINKSNEFYGVQFGGLYNHADNLVGVQLSGLINVAKDVYGVQFGGLVNIAKRVDGIQLGGLINIAEKNDYPIGLINIIKTGEKSIGLTYNEVGNFILSFRSGGRVLYGIIGIGNSYDGYTVFEGGFGAHINISSKFRINNELKTAFITKFKHGDVAHQSFSVLPSYKFTKRFELFAGPSFNYMSSDNVKNADVFPNYSVWKKYKVDSMKQMFIGYTVGLKFIF